MKLVLLALLVALLSVSVQGFKRDSVVESKYTVEILQEGGTQYANRGVDEIHIAYVGRLAADGKEFRRVEASEAYKFVAGQGALRCWNELTLRMAVGDKIKCICPSIYAHGSQGYRDLVPPHADLDFEIEVVKIQRKSADL